MKHQSIKSFSIAGVLGLFVAFTFPSVSQAILIPPGFDLLQTQPGTTFDPDGPSGAALPIPFIGVPLGSFNFPGIGVRNTGNTDTIIQRKQQADTTNPAPIQIEMVALQLRSLTPLSGDPDGPGPLPFLPLDFYFITLQSARGGSASTGTMTIGPTTFTSIINVFFDVRQGSLTGPIVLFNNDTICSAPLVSFLVPCTPGPVPWSPTAPPFVLRIAGVNDDSFFPGVFGGTTVQPFDEEGLLAKHFSTVTTPEPAAVLLLGLGLIALAAVGRKRLFKRM